MRTESRLASHLFRCKSIDQLLSDSENAEIKLKKSLGWLSLTSLGIGAVIGSGIFTVVGTAIAGQKMQSRSILNAPLLQYLIYHSNSFGRPGAGPAIAISFILVAIVCGFASRVLCGTGGDDSDCRQRVHLYLRDDGRTDRLDYRLGFNSGICRMNMAVSVGFSAHVVDLLDWFGLHPDPRWISPAYLPTGLQDLQGSTLYGPGWHFGFNWPAFIIVMLLTVLLVRGIKESAETEQHHGAAEDHGDYGLRDFRGAHLCIRRTGIPLHRMAGREF